MEDEVTERSRLQVSINHLVYEKARMVSHLFENSLLTLEELRCIEAFLLMLPDRRGMALGDAVNRKKIADFVDGAILGIKQWRFA